MQYTKSKRKTLEILHQLAGQLFVIQLNDDNKKGHSQNLLEFNNDAQKILKNDMKSPRGG